MRKRSVVLSRSAARDLEEIADYSSQRWGSDQARRYITALRSKIASLADSALLYPVQKGSRQNLRCQRSGSHLIFYEIGEHRVRIVRILHQRMEVGDAFG